MADHSAYVPHGSSPLLALAAPETIAMSIADIVLPKMPFKPKRDTVSKDKVLCEYCTAKCCRYFALPLETPTTREEYFETAEQVEEYMDAVLGPGGMEVGDGRKKKNRSKSIRSKKPSLLPVLA